MPEIKAKADKTPAQSLLMQDIAIAGRHPVSLHRSFPSIQAFRIFEQKLPSHQVCHIHEAIRDPSPKHRTLTIKAKGKLLYQFYML